MGTSRAERIITMGSGKVSCACGKQYSWKPELAGKRAKCKCGGVVKFPAEDPAAAAVPDIPDVPEGFEDMSAGGGDDIPPPPPPPPPAYAPPSSKAAARRGGGGTAVATPPPAVGGAVTPGGGGGGLKMHWNWKAGLSILGGLLVIGFGVLEFVSIGKKEAAHQAVEFTGRRSGWMQILYGVGGKWGVLGLFVVAGIVTIGGGVLVLLGKKPPHSDEH
jgi:hypothetical protein